MSPEVRASLPPIMVLLLALAACCLCPIFCDGAPIFYRVHGHSMEPVLIDGDLMIVSPRPYSQMAQGDLVIRSCSWRDDLICHQAIRRYHRWWVTQGLANRFPDPDYLTASNYVGYVAWHQPHPL